MKKTALKTVFAFGTSSALSTKVARTIGTAPRSPAQPEQRLVAVCEVGRETQSTPTPPPGLITSISSNVRAIPGTATSGQIAREDEQAEDDEERHLRKEGEAFVEGNELPAVTRRRAAYGEADEVDREEAAAADHVCGAERERACGQRRDRHEGADRVEARGRTPTKPQRRARPRQRARARSAARSRAIGRRAHRCCGCSIHAINPSVNAIPIGSLPPDSASSVRARGRRMCVKRSVAKTAAASVAATTAPRRTDSSQDRSKSTYAAAPVSKRADDDADRAQQRRRHGHLPQAPPGGLQPTLVQNQREPDHPDSARELRVVELDSARAVRSEQHSDRRGTQRGRAAPCVQLPRRRRCSLRVRGR